MNRRKRRILRKKHVSELYQNAIKGCSDSLRVLIDLQQDGKALRYYPAGRTHGDQEGMVAVSLKLQDSHVIARSGQPQYPMLFTRETANMWIVGMATMMHEAVHRYAGEERDLTRFHQYRDECTDDFEISVDTAKCGERLVCTIEPLGEQEWVIPIHGAGDFIKEALEATEKVGWTLSATKPELETVLAYTDGELIGTWDTDH